MTHIPLFSIENKIPLNKFDILGFSLLYELNYSNILTILDLGRIPIFSSERDLNFPLVIAGGPAVFNPEPVADIFDLFLIGDGEEAFLEIIEKFKMLKAELKEKDAVLKEMAKIKGVYVPSLYTAYKPYNSCLLAEKPGSDVPASIEKRVMFPFHKAPFPDKIIVPNISAIFNRIAVEVARGCPQNCRFCQARNIYFPHRIRRPSFIIKKVMSNMQSTGYEDVSLAALSVGDYPYLNELIDNLMRELYEQKVSLSLSSLRPECLSSDIAENIIKVRKTGFTLVPEAGTERLRRVINKHLNDNDLQEASRNAFSQGWRKIKLYFMVGLPTEEEEDLQGIVGGSSEEMPVLSNSGDLDFSRLQNINVKAEGIGNNLNTLVNFFENQKLELNATPSIKPTKGWITSSFGMRDDPFTGKRAFHWGIDIATQYGNPVITTADGVVFQTKTEKIGGKTIKINHPRTGYTTVYCHLNKYLVKPGQRVKRGDTIGLVGKTGKATSPHVHYEVRLNGKRVNPWYYILDD